MKRMTLRRVTLVLLGLGISVAAVYLALPASEWLAENISGPSPSGPFPGRNPGPLVYAWPLRMRSLLTLMWLAFLLAAFVPIVYWTPRPRENVRNLLTLLGLAISLPISAVNFATGDAFIPAGLQLFLDLYLVFSGTAAPILLWHTRTESLAANIARALLGSVMLFAGILLPALYAFTWLAISLGYDLSIGAWFTPLSAGVAAAIGIYRTFAEAHRRPVLIERMEVAHMDARTYNQTATGSNITQTQATDGGTASVSVQASQAATDASTLIAEIARLVSEVKGRVAVKQAEALERHSKTLREAAGKNSRSWYEVSLEGLTEAATAVGELGKPILDAVKKLRPLIETVMGG